MSDMLSGPANSVATGNKQTSLPIVESGDQSGFKKGDASGSGGGMIKGPGAQKPEISPGPMNG